MQYKYVEELICEFECGNLLILEIVSGHSKDSHDNNLYRTKGDI